MKRKTPTNEYEIILTTDDIWHAFCQWIKNGFLGSLDVFGIVQLEFYDVTSHFPGSILDEPYQNHFWQVNQQGHSNEAYFSATSDEQRVYEFARELYQRMPHACLQLHCKMTRGNDTMVRYLPLPSMGNLWYRARHELIVAKIAVQTHHHPIFTLLPFDLSLGVDFEVVRDKVASRYLLTCLSFLAYFIQKQVTLLDLVLTNTTMVITYEGEGDYPEGTAFTLAFYKIHPSEHVMMESYGDKVDGHFNQLIKALPKSAQYSCSRSGEPLPMVLFRSQKRVIKATGFDLFTDPDKLIHGSWRQNVFG